MSAIVKTMQGGATSFIGHMCEKHIEEAKGNGCEVFHIAESDWALCGECELPFTPEEWASRTKTPLKFYFHSSLCG